VRATIPFKNYKQAGWGVVNPLHPQDIQAFVIDEETSALHASDRPPAGLYNGMIASIANYTIRGAPWYQGRETAGARFNTVLYYPHLFTIGESFGTKAIFRS
jgi:hypothetical protein